MNLIDTFKPTTTSTLKNLVHVLHDGQLGYRQAAEHTKDEQLKVLFSQFSLQRSKFAGELQAELLSLGEANPEKEGSTFSGGVHRAWIDLKASLVNGDDYQVLSEVERGEDAAKQAYHDALLDDSLPITIRRTILAQQSQVHLAHDEIKSLRDAIRPS